MSDTNLVRWTKDSRIFIDTCSLMNEAAANSIKDYIVPTCQFYRIPELIVIKSVVDELNRLSTSKKNKETTRKAIEASKLLEDLENSGLVQVIGSLDDVSFADSVFISKFHELRRTRRLVIFTQDTDLAKDILAINHTASVNGHPINVFKFGRDGAPWRGELVNGGTDRLIFHRFNERYGFSYVNDRHTPAKIKNPPVRRNIRSRSQAKSKSSAPQPFKLKHQAEQLDDTPIDTRIPAVGDEVIISGGRRLCLTNVLGRGGEGIAYETNDSELACKIYRPDRLKKSTIDKLELMTSRTVNHSAICWPVSVAHNSDQDFVGYVMPKAAGKELRRSVFIKPILETDFPEWTRLHLVKLTSAILDAVAYLHELNVLLGDINPANILVADENTVFFVDCDSYQIEGYPCCVGMPPFLAPELYGHDFSSTLRTKEHEYFAIATLVFMLLHPGKAPYSYKGGEDPAANVKQMHFPYPRGSIRSQGVPHGPWRYIFSNLPRHMKDAFHHVFTDKNREPVRFWQERIERYERNLLKSYVSNELFPREFKKLTDHHYEQWRIARGKCERCGDNFPIEHKVEDDDVQGRNVSSRPPQLCPTCFQHARGRKRVDNSRASGSERPRQSESSEGNSEIPLWPALPTWVTSLFLGGNRDE